MSTQEVTETREQAILRALRAEFTQIAEEAAQKRTDAEAELGRAVAGNETNQIDRLAHKTQIAQALAEQAQQAIQLVSGYVTGMFVPDKPVE